MWNLFYYTSNLSIKPILNSLSFLTGLANLPIANKSLLSSYKPIVVIYGAKFEPVTKSWYVSAFANPILSANDFTPVANSNIMVRYLPV